MIDLDRRNPTPVAQQLETVIRGQIARGELRPGDRLPTEHELCARLGVSRTPIRRALGELTALGLLVRYPGRGTFVAASSATVESPDVTTLSVVLAGDRWCWLLQRAVAIWQAEHPEQQVRLRFSIVDKPHLRARIAMAVAEGTAGDISLIDSAWVAEFADRGYLQSFDAIDARQAGEMAEKLIPQLRLENSYDGELYALPPAADVALLWYRKDWFAQEEMTPPQTWDEWIEAARHFQRAEVRARYGLGHYPVQFTGGVAAEETATFQLLPILWSAGADVITNGEVVLNSAAAVSAVEFVADLVRRHRVAPIEVASAPWNGPLIEFASGAVAFALGGSYERSFIKAVAGWDEAECQERLAFVPIPAGPGGQPATLLGGMSLAIHRQSRHQVRALDILARTTDEDALMEFSSRSGENPPSLAANARLSPESEPFLHAVAQLVGHARARWPLAEYARVSTQIARMFESAILGELRPEQAVARAAAVISGITGLPERGERRSVWFTPTPVSSRRW